MPWKSRWPSCTGPRTAPSGLRTTGAGPAAALAAAACAPSRHVTAARMTARGRRTVHQEFGAVTSASQDRGPEAELVVGDVVVGRRRARGRRVAALLVGVARDERHPRVVAVERRPARDVRSVRVA